MYTTQLADEVRPRGKSDEESLREVGFRWGNKGTHTSRTIMLDELRAVLAKCSPPDAARDTYLSSIHEDNLLARLINGLLVIS